MTQEVQAVKTKIFDEFIRNNQQPIYDPDLFREFCLSAGANRLFDVLMQSITSPRHSKERMKLNKKRVVSLIYKLCLDHKTKH
jgi:acyl carrier protein phosphodiesterase